jgi:hypothetical protein
MSLRACPATLQLTQLLAGLALQLVGLALQLAALDLHFPVLALRLAGLGPRFPVLALRLAALDRTSSLLFCVRQKLSAVCLNRASVPAR